MPMVVVRNDITRIEADAIVNPANRRLEHGNGTSDAIFQRAGAEKLEKACHAIGTCEPGCAVATDGFSLPCRYIIHAVGPLYVDGGRGEEALLRSAYLSALKLAQEKGLKAGVLVKELSAIAGGKGGGKPDFAMAGLKDETKIDEALAAVSAIVKKALG